MINSVLVKYGEIALRGKNREKYELMLMEQIRRATGCNYVKREQGRFWVECSEDDVERAIGLMTKIPGIHSVCPCVKTSVGELPELAEICLRYVKQFHSDEECTFKVKTKRADKRYQSSSNDVSAYIGEVIIENCPNIRVNVVKPDFILNVEIRTSVYIYSKEMKGFGGLPVSSSGNAMCLLSGGIDSPVAAFLMAKRGVYQELVYFHSPPYVSALARQKVIDLAEKLSQYMGRTKLHIVNFTELQEYLRESVPEDKLTVFMKRSMLAIAEMLATKNRMLALVVGDSVGQVASQTLHAINSIDSAVAIPILRPLAGNNKQETIDLARIIGTFDISIQPYEDCCTVFVPKHPETKPKKSVIDAIERSLERLPSLRKDAFEGIETLRLGCSESGGETGA